MAEESALGRAAFEQSNRVIRVVLMTEWWSGGGKEAEAASK